jgi:uncharacterized protein
MKTSLYVGRVSHTRLVPRRHHFSYRLGLMLVNLNELDASQESRHLWPRWWRVLFPIRSGDHLRGLPRTPVGTLRQRLSELVEDRLGLIPKGDIFLLTGFGFLWHRFNPVSFYYCLDADDALDCIVAEVTNTPWKEQFYYVLDARRQRHCQCLRFRCGKEFHVSPFMPMDTTYGWLLTRPGSSLGVGIDVERNGQRCFEARLRLKARELNTVNLLHCLLRQPLMSLQVVLAIHWQALRLWCRSTPLFLHPKHNPGGTR